MRTNLVRSVLLQDPNCNKRLLSSVLKTSRSLLYYSSKMNEKDLLVKANLEAIHTQHPWYGHRRIAWSMQFSFAKVRRLMKKFNIAAKVKKRRAFVKPNDANLPPMEHIPNLVKDIIVTKPNQVWRTDFTYLCYKGIFFYLATVIDDFTKEIIGYSIGMHHTQEFVLEAIKHAIAKTRAIPDILHSDQGSEYRSFLFLDFLTRHFIRVSMSTKSSPWQNGTQESYYGKFKLEMDNLNRYESFEALIEAIHHRIRYYNHDRIHTKLRMSPVEFREQYELLMKTIQKQEENKNKSEKEEEKQAIIFLLPSH